MQFTVCQEHLNKAAYTKNTNDKLVRKGANSLNMQRLPTKSIKNE